MWSSRLLLQSFLNTQIADGETLLLTRIKRQFRILLQEFTFFTQNPTASARSRSNSDKTSVLWSSRLLLQSYLNTQIADGETRTPDPRITNALLYQLSHIGIIIKYHQL